jgi:hypothetical protein
MKRAFLNIIFVLTGLVCFGQVNNSGIDIKYIHSENGKEWKRQVRVDGHQVAKSLEDDVFIFYSSGAFKYDHAGTVSHDLTNAKTKNWSYNNDTNILVWEFYLPNGSVKNYKAELTFLDDNRAVMNLSEDGKEPTIVVLIVN